MNYPLVGRIIVSDEHEIRVELTNWNGHLGVDIRHWRKPEGKPPFPEKGLTIPIDKLPECIAILRKAQKDLARLSRKRKWMEFLGRFKFCQQIPPS